MAARDDQRVRSQGGKDARAVHDGAGADPLGPHARRVRLFDDGAAEVACDELPVLLDATWAAVEGLMTQWRARIGLGTHERMVLSQLWLGGPMPMAEVASRVRLSRGALTSLVDRLEDAGYLTRVNDEADRRRTLLHLTDLSASELQPLAEPYRRELDELRGSLDDEQWRTVLDFLLVWRDLAVRHTERLRCSAAVEAAGGTDGADPASAGC